MIAYSKELLPRIARISTDYQRKIRANPRNPRLWFCFPVKNGRALFSKHGDFMQENSDSNLNTVIAFVISILTIFSALLGWQMGNIAGDASDEYSSAQRAELNAQKVRSINTLATDENHRSFLTYKRYYDEYQLVSEQLLEAKSAVEVDDALVSELDTKQQELRALYLSNLRLFPNVYITRDGKYDINTQLGQMWAKAARDLDLEPKPHLKAGQLLDAQVQKIQLALILLAVSLFFYAIVSTVESLKRGYILAFTILGSVSAVAGVTVGLLYWN
jgi:hypothetical protein